MSSSTSKEYDIGAAVITWQPEKCTHSGVCVRGLPGVFNPRKKPWIATENASPEEIVDQVKKCPSGALGYYLKEEKPF